MTLYKRAVVLLALSLAAFTAAVAQVAAQQKLTLEDIHASDEFTPEHFEGGEWAEAGPVITYVEEDEKTGATNLISYNLETDEQERLIDGTQLFADDVKRLIRIEGYDYSPDKSRVLVYTDSEPVWRYNTKGYYYIFDIDSQTLTPLSSREKGYQMFAKFSPDGRRIGFVRNRNLFVVNLADEKEKQLTFDGSDGGIINGTTDWVYEEEFGLRDGWAWSPDSRYIAYVQLNETATPQFVMLDLTSHYPGETRFKYPKAGEANSEIRVGAVNVNDGKNLFFDTGTWNAGGDSLEYIPQLGWTPVTNGRSSVWLLRLNRDQNELDVLYANPADGSVKTVLEENSSTWLDVETSFGDLTGGNLTYLDDRRHFVWLSDRDGYRHLYLYENDGTFVRRLTSGAWNVTSFHGIDLSRNTIYFTGTVAGPLERHLYRVPFAGASSTGDPVQITEKEGTHHVNMSRDLRYYIDEFTSIAHPGLATLHDVTGRLLRTLEDNEALLRRLESYDVPKPEFIEVAGADGTMLNGYIIKPSDFDPGKKYPLLMYVYGGPGSQEVLNEWGGSRYLWHAYLAEEKGLLVACIDNRGTGGRSKDFKSITYKRLGTIEAEDQIAAARHLGELAYVDEDRIGIWGWSYGGYMTLMSMLYGEGPETFKAGISVAPVVDWRQYDTIYTERYMSTPQRNARGYEVSAPTRYADNLSEDQELLIVHGDMDDNVHFQNTIQMVDALQLAGKQFDLMVYPRRNHGIYGENARLHLYTMMTNFLDANL